jgi:hypothetical protein
MPDNTSALFHIKRSLFLERQPQIFFTKDVHEGTVQQRNMVGRKSYYYSIKTH